MSGSRIRLRCFVVIGDTTTEKQGRVSSLHNFGVGIKRTKTRLMFKNHPTRQYDTRNSQLYTEGSENSVIRLTLLAEQVGLTRLAEQVRLTRLAEQVRFTRLAERLK